ncbi:MAG: trigger factor, partial [Pseudomonadota bacterium]
SNPQAMAQLRAPLFEERVVDHIIENAAVTDKTVSKEDLMKDPDGEDL